MNKHTHTHTHTHINTLTHIFTHAHAYSHTLAHQYSHTYIFTHSHTYTYSHTHTNNHTLTHIFTHTTLCTSTPIFTHTFELYLHQMIMAGSCYHCKEPTEKSVDQFLTCKSCKKTIHKECVPFGNEIRNSLGNNGKPSALGYLLCTLLALHIHVNLAEMEISHKTPHLYFHPNWTQYLTDSMNIHYQSTYSNLN